MFSGQAGPELLLAKGKEAFNSQIEIMNILTHPVHTGYQFDLAGTGHQFYSVPIPKSGEVFWDENSRPKPPNFHHLPSVSEAPVKFDLALAHYVAGFEFLKGLDIPIVFKEHCVQPSFEVPPEWRERVSYYSFSNSGRQSLGAAKRTGVQENHHWNGY